MVLCAVELLVARVRRSGHAMARALLEMGSFWGGRLAPQPLMKSGSTSLIGEGPG
jgi:hypothetical protein